MGILNLMLLYNIVVDNYEFHDYSSVIEENLEKGFNNNLKGHDNFLKKMQESLSVLKTGTTIVGICCKDGVVLGSDTRATSGPLVMDKNILKIHTISPRIYSCAAGTSADCDQLCRRAGYHLASLRLEREMTGGPKMMDPIEAAVRSISKSITSPTDAARPPSGVFVLGGVDELGPSLFEIRQDGTSQRVSYAALGSGSTYAMSVLETDRFHWRARIRTNISNETESNNTELHNNHNNNNVSKGSVDIETLTLSNCSDEAWGWGSPEGEGSDMMLVEPVSVSEALSTVRRAVQSGILNDLGSGSHVDLCVVQRETVRRWREHFTAPSGPPPALSNTFSQSSSTNTTPPVTNDTSAGDDICVAKTYFAPQTTSQTPTPEPNALHKSDDTTSSFSSPPPSTNNHLQEIGELLVSTRRAVRGLRWKGKWGSAEVTEEWEPRGETMHEIEVEKIE